MKKASVGHHSLIDLYQAILKLKNTDECKRFFRDIATHEELRDLSDRWKVARLVHKGMPYREIAKKTGVSTATITRVAHWLHYGEGGYQLVLKRLNIK